MSCVFVSIIVPGVPWRLCVLLFGGFDIPLPSGRCYAPSRSAQCRTQWQETTGDVCRQSVVRPLPPCRVSIAGQPCGRPPPLSYTFLSTSDRPCQASFLRKPFSSSSYQKLFLYFCSMSLFSRVRQSTINSPCGLLSVRGTRFSLPAVTSSRVRMEVLRSMRCLP